LPTLDDPLKEIIIGLGGDLSITIDYLILALKGKNISKGDQPRRGLHRTLDVSFDVLLKEVS
jgi:hypothetical protein